MGTLAAPRRGAPTWAVSMTMAVTGLVWAGFAMVHLYGNLKVYLGPESFNAYAAWLREALYPLVPHEGVLWALRIVLVIALVLHIWGALVLTARNRRARGPHRARPRGATALLARSMLATGLVLLAFLVVHVLDMTLGVVPLAPAGHTPAPEGGSHAYANLIASFERPWAAYGYAVAMLALAIHLLHGLMTAATDLGVGGRRLRSAVRLLAVACAVAVVLGNALIPLLVQSGVLS